MDPEALKRRGIPKLFWEAQLNGNARVNEVAALGPCDVLIGGPNGVGKSYTAAVLALLWHAQWINAAELILQAKRPWKPTTSESEHAVFRRWSSYRTVVVDDLMAGATSAHATGWLLAIVNARMDACLSTIITCDRSLQDVRRLSPALASRLSSYEAVWLTGPDRRAKRSVPRPAAEPTTPSAGRAFLEER